MGEVGFLGRSKEAWTAFLKEVLAASSLPILSWASKPDGTSSVETLLDGKPLTLHFFLKSISGGGWKEKPWVYRIQVRKLEGDIFPKNSAYVLSLLLGLCLYDGEPVIASWNPFRFLFHETNRSCYLHYEDLLRLEEEPEGFYVSHRSAEPVSLARKDSFGKLLRHLLKGLGR